jgi:pimeloyl-ACP methyl ester carboxylesterase
MKNIDLEYRKVGNGESTLILETGIGGSFYNWYSFIQEIKKHFTVILYHRAGYGNSPNSEKARTTRNIAEELNNLVEELGITDKFILMGHSFGGLCAQQYALMYPHKIKGLVLVDSTSYNFQKLYDLTNPVMNSLISVDERIKINLNNSQQTKEELQLKYTDMIIEYKKILPTQDVRGFEEFMTNPRLYKVIANEFENFGESSKNIKTMGEFPQIPLIVIARDKEISIKSFTENDIPEEEAILYEHVWRELQIELSQLSSKGELVIAEGSDHQVHLDQPDSVIQSLKRFL